MGRRINEEDIGPIINVEKSFILVLNNEEDIENEWEDFVLDVLLVPVKALLLQNQVICCSCTGSKVMRYLLSYCLLGVEQASAWLGLIDFFQAF